MRAIQLKQESTTTSYPQKKCQNLNYFACYILRILFRPIKELTLKINQSQFSKKINLMSIIKSMIPHDNIIIDHSIKRMRSLISAFKQYKADVIERQHHDDHHDFEGGGNSAPSFHFRFKSIIRNQ
jgi:hypothetical protein